MIEILALDIGTKRVGTAVYDDTTRVARPYKMFARARGVAESGVLELIASETPSIIVAGMPFNEDGSRSLQCDDVESFCRRLERRSSITVEYVDEYGSSAEARELLLHNTGKIKAAKQRASGEVDCLAAKIILDLYLAMTGYGKK